MSEPYIIVPKFCIATGEINHVGELLGYEWNDVCDWMDADELYGQDGSGFCIVDADSKFKSDGLNKIFEKILFDNPTCDEIYILNEW